MMNFEINYTLPERLTNESRFMKTLRQYGRGIAIFNESTNKNRRDGRVHTIHDPESDQIE